jgi:hypothetical protein
LLVLHTSDFSNFMYLNKDSKTLSFVAYIINNFISLIVLLMASLAFIYPVTYASKPSSSSKDLALEGFHLVFLSFHPHDMVVFFLHYFFSFPLSSWVFGFLLLFTLLS